MVNDDALQREFADSFHSKLLGTVVHELAHVLERPSPYRPRPDADATKLRTEGKQVVQFVSTDEEVATPWLGHEARFLRIAMHLWYRAKLHHVHLWPTEIVVSDYCALSPANFYAIATEKEAKHMADATFREICKQKLPDAFRRVWTRDVTHWLSRKETA